MISSMQYADRLKWQDRFSSWLQLFKTKKEKQGHLTKERSTVHFNTVYPLILLVKQLLQHHKLEFSSLEKFQTDNLEARVGQYRMVFESNYLLFVNEVRRN